MVAPICAPMAASWACVDVCMVRKCHVERARYTYALLGGNGGAAEDGPYEGQLAGRYVL